MKDERLYAKFALDFADHAKILPLSDAAFRCLVEATLWSRKHQTDGFVASRLALARWSLEALQELATNDPSNPSLVEVEGGWLIHDYAAHQETKEEIQARKERNRIAGQKGGLARAKRVAKRSASEVLSETQAEKEKEKHRELTTDVVSSRRSQANGTATATNKRGTRLPEGWMPRPETVEAIKTETGATSDQLRDQHRQFTDWAAGCTTKAAVKRDWNAAWRNWMRRAAADGKFAAKRNGVSVVSTTDERVANTLRLAERYAADEQRAAVTQHTQMGELA